MMENSDGQVVPVIVTGAMLCLQTCLLHIRSLNSLVIEPTRSVMYVLWPRRVKLPG